MNFIRLPGSHYHPSVASPTLEWGWGGSCGHPSHAVRLHLGWELSSAVPPASLPRDPEEGPSPAMLWGPEASISPQVLTLQL